MTMTTTKSTSPLLAAIALALPALLAVWNWYLRPERAMAWITALALLAGLAAALYITSRRSTTDGTDGGPTRGIADGVALAGVILTISLSARLVARLGVDRDLSQRVFMIAVGAFLTLTANTIPKTLTPLSALQCDPARVQACQRFVGWTWVLTGLALSAIWMGLPIGVARPLTVALIASAMTATLLKIVHARRMGTASL